MELAFYKLDGAGNDFVGIDARRLGRWTDERIGRLARLLCHRHHGVGADGILVILPVEQAAGAAFRMQYVNADGSIGGMCGNGARCAAVLAYHLGAAPAAMTFETDAGLYEATIVEGGARLRFPDLPALPVERRLLGTAAPLPAMDFLLCGVPHAVAFVEDLDLFPVAEAGRAVRHDPAFAPAGTNANFAEVQPDGTIRLRTYERGVEAETLACGTGSVATCCTHAARSGLRGDCRFTVIPTGGQSLGVEFHAGPGGYTSIHLTGPARLAFTGRARVDLDAGLLMG
jgi:diaminopimelate epimerase